MNAAQASTTSRRDERRQPHRIAACAVRSLHAELVLYPKPGLVSTHDSGAHADMNAATFMRSMAALRGYFVDVAHAGARRAAFGELRRLGVAAERRMLQATGGVNTHRGAIFTLGVLAAAGGWIGAERRQPTDAALREAVGAWRHDLIAFGLDRAAPPSHGRFVASRYGAAGARGEAADGFPAVFEVGLPALRFALTRTSDVRAAQVHAVFALLAHVDDTNVLYRGGPEALAFLRDQAAAFTAAGSVFTDGWRLRAETLHRRCCAQRISPGGCADLFSACWFVHQLQTNA